MRLRILALGLSATHRRITSLPDMESPISVSDYDAFALDPAVLPRTSATPATYGRRISELQELIRKKGGIIFSFLRPKQNGIWGNSGIDSYSLLQGCAPRVMHLIQGAVQPGQGERWTRAQATSGVLERYLRDFKDNIRFDAFLRTDATTLNTVGGTILAVNSVESPIAVEFVEGQARLCFVPIPHNVTGDQLGAAIARIVEAHYGGPAELEVPPWADQVAIPGASVYEGQIKNLKEQREQIDTQVLALEEQRGRLTEYKQLLFGYGRPLEKATRQSLRLVGFTVREPDEYEGEWDVDLSEPVSGRTAIGEIEGSNGAIDVDKFRQLLDYVNNEVLEGRDHKGILIGNGHREADAGESVRQSQFTQHALRGANKNAFCLLPTTELFKAVCAVLELPQDEVLKAQIRDSILSTVGVWTFVRVTRTVAEAPEPAESG